MSPNDVAAARLPWDAADPYLFYEARRRDGDVEDHRDAFVVGPHAGPDPAGLLQIRGRDADRLMTTISQLVPTVVVHHE